MEKLTRKNLLTVSAFILGVFLVIHYWTAVASALGVAAKAVAPLLVGALIAYLINILMSFYERHYFTKRRNKFGEATRTWVCLVGAVLTILLVLALIIGLIIPQFVECVRTIIEKVPGTAETLVTKLTQNERFVSLIPEEAMDWIVNYKEKLETLDWQNIIGKAVDFLRSGIGTHGSKITGVLSSTASKVGAFVIGLVFAMYYLARRDAIKTLTDRLCGALLKPKLRERVYHYASLLNACFHKYIVASCIEALILGTLCLLGMTALNLPYKAMLPALVAVMALIPIVGGTISAVVGTFMILSVSPVKALLFFIMLMVVQVIEGNIIYPKVVGKQVGAPGLVVLIAITVGGSAFGIAGMIFGVPIATAVYYEVKSYLDKKKPAGEDVPETEPQPAPAPEQ